MSKAEDKISLSHGNGGRMMQDLIDNLFARHFSNKILDEQTDSAILEMKDTTIAFTTDSFVVDPIFFPGGDIGKLAVCGTVNDLSVSGAKPLFLSVSFIIEEGLPMNSLERIVLSISMEARIAKVSIVTGDTKVVNKGKCDKIFINTSGIGTLHKKDIAIGKGTHIQPGDKIIINGTVGDHGMAVLNARETLNFKTSIQSDCASLNSLILTVMENSSEVRFMRDPTRGGVATVLNELVNKRNFGIELDESSIPVSEGVRSMCEILGYDPLFIANEGKVILVAGQKESNNIVKVMKENVLGKKSRIIGEITEDHPGKVVLKTMTGGKRIVNIMTGEQLPRIC